MSVILIYLSGFYVTSFALIMLKKGTFINKKYYKLLFASLIGAFATGVNVVLDSALSGNQLGETALTAVSIVAPLTFVIYFFSSVFAPGYGMMYGKYNGSFDSKNAHKTAGQSLITAFIVGTTLAVLLIVFKKSFLNYYNCSGELYDDASSYYNWKILSAIILPLNHCMFYLVAADADTLLISIGGTASIATNIVLSSVLCKRLGVAGLGIGTGFCEVVYLGIIMFHFLRKTNSIHFVASFRLKELINAAGLGIPIAMSYLYVALTDIVMNKVILVTCGVSMVTAYSVINFVYGIYDCFSAAYNSSSGFVCTFFGEKNNQGIRNVIKTMLKSIVGLGIIVSAALVVFSSAIPQLYGIETPEAVNASVTAVRLMALTSVPYGICYVMQSLYPSFDKIGLSLLVTFLDDILCPLAIAIPCAFIFGFSGVSAGMAINSYVACAVFSFIVIKKYGKKDFPLYLQDNGEETCSFDIAVTNESIAEIRDSVNEELIKHGYDIKNIDLIIEELFKRIYEKNPGKTVLAECTLLFGEDYVRIVVRDDGVIFNFVDENNKIESVNAYTLNCLLEQVQDKEYILTTSFNRNGFVFKKQSCS